MNASPVFNPPRLEDALHSSAYSAGFSTYWAGTLHLCSYINLMLSTGTPSFSVLLLLLLLQILLQISVVTSAIQGGVESPLVGSNSLPLSSPQALLSLRSNFHRRISVPPMHILNYWRPRKVEKHGIKRTSAARKLLETHIAELSPSNRDRAQSLLN